MAGYTAFNGLMISKYKSEWIWREAVWACLEYYLGSFQKELRKTTTNSVIIAGHWAKFQPNLT
jgi:hypothetical protein